MRSDQSPPIFFCRPQSWSKPNEVSFKVIPVDMAASITALGEIAQRLGKATGVRFEEAPEAASAKLSFVLIGPRSTRLALEETLLTAGYLAQQPALDASVASYKKGVGYADLDDNSPFCNQLIEVESGSRHICIVFTSGGTLSPSSLAWRPLLKAAGLSLPSARPYEPCGIRFIPPNCNATSK